MKIKFYKSLTTKIFILIAICLILAISANSWQNGKTFYQFLNNQIKTDIMRKTQNTSNFIATILENIASQISIVMHSISPLPDNDIMPYIKSFVSSNSEYVVFQIITQKLTKKPKTIAIAITNNILDPRFENKKTNNLLTQIEKINRNWIKNIKNIDNSNLFIKNLYNEVGIPLISYAIPFYVTNKNEYRWAILTTWQTRILNDLPQTKLKSSMILTKSGKLLFSPNKNFWNNTSLIHKIPLVKNALNNQVSSFGFNWWTDPSTNTNWFGAYSKVQGQDLIVIIISEASLIQRTIKNLILKNLLYAMLFLLLAIALSFLGTTGIISNLKELVLVTLRIAQGDFNSKIKFKTQDELAVLGLAVNHMSEKIQVLMKTQIEMAKLEKELETAKIVQNTFFPDKQLNTSRLQLSSYFRPADQCSGDWWGHYNLDNNKEFLFIADATGHGVPAALVTAMIYSLSSLLSQLIKKRKSALDPLPDILYEFNEILCTAGKNKLTMTFFALLFDFDAGIVKFTNAGHNFPLLIPKDSNDLRFSKEHKSKYILHKGIVNLRLSGDPLGMNPESKYKEEYIPIKKDDKIFLYTDGLYECLGPDGNAWGKTNFIKTIQQNLDKSPDDLKNIMTTSAFEHFKTVPPNDDITIVIAQVLNTTTHLENAA